MPLDKSGTKHAFSKNVATERRAGRPEKQAVAIAYSEQRAAHKHGVTHRHHQHAKRVLHM